MATRKNAEPKTPKAGKPKAEDNRPKDGNGDPVGAAPRERATIIPGHRGHSVPASQQYGETSQEEHRKSGYNYPDSFYKKPIPAEERVEGGPTHEGMKSRKSATENKSSTSPDETK